MHKVSFKMTLQDRLEEYNACLRYASLLRRTVKYGYALLFLTGFALTSISFLLFVYFKSRSPTWPSAPWPPHPFLAIMGQLVGVFIGFNVCYGYKIILDNSRDVRLSLEHIAFKRRIASGVVSWQNVTALSDTGAYIRVWFCQDAPNVIVVPKLAFSSLQGAEAFYTVMLTSWRKATEEQPLTLDTSGVWPPAPRPGNSGEPGDGPKG